MNLAIKTLLSLGLVFFTNDYLSAQSGPFSSDMLKEEHQNLKNILNAINNKDLLNNKDEFVKGLTCYLQEEKNIGFGCSFFTYKMGGSFTTWISILSYKGKVMQYVIDNSDDKQKVFDYILARDTALNKIKQKFCKVKKSISFYYLNDELCKDFKQNVGSVLGRDDFDIADSSEEYKGYYRILAEPVYNYYVGYLCGISETDPEGRVAVDYFVAKKDVRGIRSLTRKYNPEGRIYAIDALLSMVESGVTVLSKEDREIINKILSLDIPIHTCHGCRPEIEKPIDAVDKWLAIYLR